MKTQKNEIKPGNQTEIPTIPAKEFLTVRDLAQLLQVTEMTIYRMCKRGDLPHYRIGRITRFKRTDVETFLERCRHVAQPIIT